MTSEPITARAEDALAYVLHLLNRYNLSCLPVTEGRRLVGIITRSDIIQAEALHLHGEIEELGSKPEPSYIIFQSRVPATGRGRILVPLSNPKTAPTLLKMALAIANSTDVTILGASREEMLQQAIEGNIPAAIARHSNCSAILVRS